MSSPLPETTSDSTAAAADRGMLWAILVVVSLSPWPLGSRLPWAAMTAAVVVMTAGSTWFLVRLWGSARPRFSPLYGPVLAFLVWVALQWLTGWTIYPHGTAYDGVLMASYAIVFVTCFELAGDRTAARRLHMTTMALAFAVGIFGLIQYLTWNGRLYWALEPPYGGNAFGPFNNRNYFAGYLVVTLGVAVGALLANRRQRQRNLLMSLTWISVVALLVSLSRGGFLSLGVACLAALWVCQTRDDLSGPTVGSGPSKQPSRRGWSLRDRRTRTALAATLAVFVGVLWLGQGDRVFSRLETLLRFQQESSFLVRLRYAQEALQMVADRPLAGFGLGSYVWVFPNYRDEATVELQTNAHNEYLEMAAETGLVGAAICLAFLVMLFRAARERVRAAADREELGIRVGALCSWIGICVYALTDFPTVIPAINYVLAVQAALVVADIGARESH